MSSYETILAIALLACSTLVSEDLTCITAGQLVARGQLALTPAVFGCFLGIYVGDLALWLVGRAVGPRVFRFKFISHERAERLADWFNRNAPRAILAARFLPGARLPMYIGSGMIARSGPRFAIWTLIAALLWTPIIVIIVARYGDAVTAPLQRYFGAEWIAIASGVITCFIALRIAMSLTTEIGRAKCIARISRTWRWEFWPMWAFYPPVIVWIAWLTVRHRSFTVITVANPTIPHGGFVGESKSQILSLSNHSSVIPTVVVDRDRFDTQLSQLGWPFPIIFKPDAGERGAGVKLIRSMDDARSYLRSTNATIIAQPFHPGPYEAGVFYYRTPGESRGHIFSITDKVFSEVVGDDESTLEELIWRHPRFRMQARTFLTRHAADASRVLASGEHFRLAVAGNHCQGTMFRDGSHLHTPELERAIDEIAQSFPGVHFGRLDIRYSDVERFRAGEDLCVIELNGVTSESTNIYDPSWSLLKAYRTLFRQWSLLFRIGEANRRRGANQSSIRALATEIVKSRRTRTSLSS
jgi:membrane protein DedA with SNARE-associated domain